MDDKIMFFCNKYLNEKGYNIIFMNAKSKLNKNNKITLFIIVYFYIIAFFCSFNILNVPSEKQIETMINDCKKVNSLKVIIKADGQFDKTELFDFVKKLIDKYYSVLINGGKTLNSEEDCVDYFVKFINKKSSNIKYKNVVYPLFDDIIGLEKAKEIVRERVINPVLHRDIYEKYGVSSGGGILLFGLPGTGKTMFAKAVANEIKGHFISVSSSDIKSKYFGETENKIKDLFSEARKHDVSVIFFDEFEAIGVSRDKFGSEITASTVVPELLSQIQGFKQHDGILLIIAATNRPWDIDAALLRPGRFDSLVYVDLPNIECRKMMFKNNLIQVNAAEYVFDFLSQKTEDYNGADIKNVSDNLVRLIIQKEIEGIDNYELTIKDCYNILKEIKSSVIKKDYNRMKQFIIDNN